LYDYAKNALPLVHRDLLKIAKENLEILDRSSPDGYYLFRREDTETNNMILYY
jgi:hypothetical protein